MSHKFNVGDTVKIRTDLRDLVDTEINDTYVAEEMGDLEGHVATITWWDKDIECYHINLDDGEWWWNDGMFDAILPIPLDGSRADILKDYEDINKPHYTVNYTIPNCSTIFSMDVNLAEYNTSQHYYLFVNAEGKPFYLFESNVDSIVRIS